MTTPQEIREQAREEIAGAMEHLLDCARGNRPMEHWNDHAAALLNKADTLLTEYGEAVRREGKAAQDAVYKERDMLVAALSKVFPSYLARHEESDTSWEDEWRWIVYIELPTGQVSWHIHDSERPMFEHLEVRQNNWDGHTTEQKYERLAAIEQLTIK